MHQLHRKIGGQAGGLGRFGQHGIARRKGCCDLACEDGQGEIPRADTGENTPRSTVQLQGLRCIIAQEIDRLAQLAHAIIWGFARLARQKRKECAKMGLV